jgi:hypothetical protein
LGALVQGKSQSPTAFAGVALAPERPDGCALSAGFLAGSGARWSLASGLSALFFAQ